MNKEDYKIAIVGLGHVGHDEFKNIDISKLARGNTIIYDVKSFFQK